VLKLNIGAGNKPLPKADGWVNCDFVVDSRFAGNPDYEWQIGDVTMLPFESNTADEILASHVIEHIHPTKVEETLAEWFAVLKPGGYISLEQPDLIKCCVNVLQALTSNDDKMVLQYGMWGLYGNSEREGDYMNHMWGYTPATLSSLLDEVGFIDITEETPVVKPWGAQLRDFRLVARKPE